MKRLGRLPAFLDGSILAVALAGFGINLLLLIRYLAGGNLAGCGGGSSCEVLLNSRWAQVLGIPVSGFGALVYLVLMVAILAKAWRWVGLCLGLLVGAAVWFMFVQAVLLGRFCPWCMTAHAAGLTLAVLGGWRLTHEGVAASALKSIAATAAAAGSAICLLQLIGPQPVTYRIDDAAARVTTPPEFVHARGSGRKITFAGVGKTYDVAALPHLGPVDARLVMVEYFDYSCAACQTMRGHLDALLAKHPHDLCLVVLPVPLEHACNHALGSGDTEHPGSCQLARLALAIWRAQPAAFAAFHHELLNGLSPAEARTLALTRVAAKDLAAAMEDPWIDELIQADIRDWVSFSRDTKILPKLIVRDKRIVHGLPSGEADFIRVIERELGL